MKVLASILLCSVFAASALEVRKLKVEIVVICRGMVERFGTRLRELALCFQRWAGTRAQLKFLLNALNMILFHVA